MRKITLLIIVMFCFTSLSYADLTAAQKNYFGSNIEWVSTTNNIHGDQLLKNNQINYTMGYSTANGKWFHFIIGAASAVIDTGTCTEEYNTTRTVPINVDGYTRATIVPYTVNTSASFTGPITATTNLTVSLVPRVSMIPQSVLGNDTTLNGSLTEIAPLNVATAGTAQLGAGAVISTRGAKHYELMGAKSLIICASGLAATCTLAGTTCFTLSLSK